MCLFIKVISIPIIVCLLNNKLFIFSMSWPEDNKIPNIDEKESIESSMCPDEFQDFCGRKSSNLENLFRVFFKKQYGTTTGLSKTKRGPVSTFHESSLNNGQCQCGMTFKPMDLGGSAFPRYFHTGVCKKNTCGVFHQCNPRKYKVHILKRREADSEPNTELEELHESVFPESLKEEWMPDFVNIVVGCECLPKKL